MIKIITLPSSSLKTLWFRFHEFEIPLAYHNEVNQQMHKRIYH